MSTCVSRTPPRGSYRPWRSTDADPARDRILIADDFTLVREGLKKVLDAKPDLEVVAEAADGAEAVDKALREDVDLAVLDVSMPRMTGIRLRSSCRSASPTSRS